MSTPGHHGHHAAHHASHVAGHHAAHHAHQEAHRAAVERARHQGSGLRPHHRGGGGVIARTVGLLLTLAVLAFIAAIVLTGVRPAEPQWLADLVPVVDGWFRGLGDLLP